MTNCDTCGVTVSTTGFLGGGIVCHECAEAKRKHDTETLQQRVDKYGGGEDLDAQTTLKDLCYGDNE